MISKYHKNAWISVVCSNYIIINHTELADVKLKLFKLSFIDIPIPFFDLLVSCCCFFFARYKRYEILLDYPALWASKICILRRSLHAKKKSGKQLKFQKTDVSETDILVSMEKFTTSIWTWMKLKLDVFLDPSKMKIVSFWFLWVRNWGVKLYLSFQQK